MSKKLCCVTAALLAISPIAYAAESGTTPVPKAVAATEGCWGGRGEVMGKPVTLAVTARPIVQNAILALDAESGAITDPKDKYSAHLIFGGADNQTDATADQIVGFWADSFGGAFTANGRGESRSDGFDIAYQYADNSFVNRWRFAGDRLTWVIVAQDSRGVEKPFASYMLRKVACRPNGTH